MRFAPRSTRIALFLSPLAVAACGSPPPPAPPTPPKPVAIKEAVPTTDLSAVPRPESVVVHVRLSKPEQSLKVIGDWSHLPLPGADMVGDLMTGAAVGRVIDLAQPIDIAVGLGDPRSPEPQVAVSAAVRSLDEAKTAFSEKYSFAPGPNGGTRILGLGDPDDDQGRPCDLAPSAGSAPVRLVCAGGKSAIDALEPWLTRSAPRETYSQDVHVDVRIAPVRPLVRQFRALLPVAITRALGARSGPPAVGQAIDAFSGDLADVTSDLEQIAADISLSDDGAHPAAADATVALTFGGATATLSRLAIAHPERADAVPGAFWRLPADTDVAYFTRGIDAKDLGRTRELGQGLLLAALEKEGFGEGERKAVTELIGRAVDLYTGPMIMAHGLDAPALDKARAALEAAKTDAARAEAEQALGAQLAGWSVTLTQEPIANVAKLAKDAATAVSGPGVTKWAKEHGHGMPVPTAKITPLPKTAHLPDGSVHLEIAGYHEQDVPPASAAAPAAQGKKGAPPPKKAPKPRTLHVVAVPDAGQTWLVMAPSLDLAIARARAVLPGAPEAATLAKREGLDALRDARAHTGGFLSARGVLTSSPLNFVTGTETPRRRLLDGLASTPARGATPIVFTTRAETKAAGGTFTVTAKAPRAAVEDIIKFTMRM